MVNKRNKRVTITLPISLLASVDSYLCSTYEYRIGVGDTYSTLIEKLLIEFLRKKMPGKCCT